MLHVQVGLRITKPTKYLETFSEFKSLKRKFDRGFPNRQFFEGRYSIKCRSIFRLLKKNKKPAASGCGLNGSHRETNQNAYVFASIKTSATRWRAAMVFIGKLFFVNRFSATSSTCALVALGDRGERVSRLHFDPLDRVVAKNLRHVDLCGRPRLHRSSRRISSRAGSPIPSDMRPL